uniref:Fido domain-containing protein n=1 Tax=Globodera rostochiensis TaxID=31243 RepID=A0A914H3U6_GLORO
MSDLPRDDGDIWCRKEKKKTGDDNKAILDEIRSGQITPPSLFAADEAGFDELEALSTKRGDFNVELLRKLHVIALTREGQAPSYAGLLRGESGESPSGTIKIGSSYVAPINSKVPGLMQEFVAWLNGEEASRDGVIRYVAEAHIRLAALHPYGNGNGRSSRALEHNEYNKALKSAIVDGQPNQFYDMMSTWIQNYSGLFDAERGDSGQANRRLSAQH